MQQDKAKLPPRLSNLLKSINIHDTYLAPAMQKLEERSMCNMTSYLKAVNLRLETAQTGACIQPGKIEHEMAKM